MDRMVAGGALPSAQRTQREENISCSEIGAFLLQLLP